MGYLFSLGEEPVQVTPAYHAGGFDLLIEGSQVRASLTPGIEEGEFYLARLGEPNERVFVASHGDEHFVHYRGRTFKVVAQNALEAAQREAAASSGVEEIRAPMPGVVVEVAVAVGGEVAAGDLLMTLESMKLQTAMTAPQDARVAEIYVATGASFDQGAPLVRLESLSLESESSTANEESTS